MGQDNSKLFEEVKGVHKTPSGHTVVPREATFTFDDNIPRYWQGEVFATRMFDAMQLTFPDGERMFIQSVRNYADKVKTPKLKEQVKQFIYQEGQHGKAHADFADHMIRQGVPVAGSIKRIRKGLQFFQKYAPKKFQLASTVAAEHLTASLGEYIMGREDNLMQNAHPTMRAFYMWHGIEEVEHKAVAWDVYQEAAGGGYFTRALAMLVLYPLLFIPLTGGVLAIMHSEGKLNLREVGKGMSAMFGKRGLFSNTFIPVLRYFVPGFHPWQTGYPPNFHQWKEVYSETKSLDEAMKAVPF